MANFEPLSRGQPHSPDVNHCVLHLGPKGHREPRNEVGSLSPAECLVGLNWEPSNNHQAINCDKCGLGIYIKSNKINKQNLHLTCV